MTLPHEHVVNHAIDTFARKEKPSLLDFNHLKVVSQIPSKASSVVKELSRHVRQQDSQALILILIYPTRLVKATAQSNNSYC